MRFAIGKLECYHFQFSVDFLLFFIYVIVTFDSQYRPKSSQNRPRGIRTRFHYRRVYMYKTNVEKTRAEEKAIKEEN